jgi:type IV pilus assembly protein PilM
VCAFLLSSSPTGPMPLTDLLARLKSSSLLSKSGPRTVTGIDIGSQFIKIAVINHSSDENPALNRLIAVETPRDSVVEGEILDADAVANAIIGAFQHYGLPNDNLVGVLSNGRDVVIKRIDVDRADLPGLDEMMKFSAQEEMPFEYGSGVHSYQVLPVPETTRQIPVLLVGVKNSLVSDRRGLFERIGTLKVLDVDSFALFNALERTLPGLRGPAMHIHLGYDTSIVLVIDAKGQMQTARDLTNSIRKLRESLQNKTGLSVEEADEAIHRQGFALEHADIFQQWLEPFVQDIARIWLTEALGSERGRPLYLSGGGSLIPDVVNGLTDALETSTTSRVDLLAALGVPANATGIIEAPLSAENAGEIGFLAVGLALRTDALQTKPDIS